MKLFNDFFKTEENAYACAKFERNLWGNVFTIKVIELVWTSQCIIRTYMSNQMLESVYVMVLFYMSSFSYD